MTDEEIKAMQAEVVALKAQVAEKDTTIAQLGEDLKGKDGEIGKLKEHTKNQAENFKKLRDMTQEEKDMYTEKELELMKRTEEVESRAMEIEKTANENLQKQKGAIIDNLATKYAKGDKEIEAQIKINLGKLNPELLNPAMTEAELTPHVESAFNMLGIVSQPDALRDANNYTGAPVEIKNDSNFADTQAGKELAGNMGLNIGKVEDNNK